MLARFDDERLWEAVLGRPTLATDTRDFAHLTGRRVMVTGAGGSIGRELVRQIALARPERLTLVELSEFNLYEVNRLVCGLTPNLVAAPLLVDVRHTYAVEKVFEAERPEIVFHAAALKHVPLLESGHNLIEGARTNVLGTKNIADNCVRTGVRELVMISTDKAVNPTSVMGLTKRAAELYVHQVGNGAGTTSCTTVRFGNVCGSSGSVIPLFVEQVRRGGPLTLTHPDVVRYLMTIPEAVSLVLQASWLGVGEPAGIYVLDMGAPVRVQLIAERVCHHLGKTLHDDIAIEIIGLRPGEKLFEELAYADERPEPTARPGISRVTASAAPVVSADWMALLKTYSDERKAADVLRLLTDLVPQYRSAPCV